MARHISFRMFWFIWSARYVSSWRKVGLAGSVTLFGRGGLKRGDQSGHARVSDLGPNCLFRVISIRSSSLREPPTLDFIVSLVVCPVHMPSSRSQDKANPFFNALPGPLVQVKIDGIHVPPWRLPFQPHRACLFCGLGAKMQQAPSDPAPPVILSHAQVNRRIGLAQQIIRKPTGKAVFLV